MKKKRRYKKKRVVFFAFFILLLGGGFIGMHFFHGMRKNVKEVKESKDEKFYQEEKTNVSLEKAPRNYQEFFDLDDGDYLTDKGYTLTIKDGIAYIDGYIIVNKTYALSNSYVPVNPHEKITGERCNSCINEDVMKAFLLMQSDATSLGLNIYISSGYRSYSYQDRLYHNYVSISGKEKADTYSARPGHSEHQTGTCFDLNTIDDSFANTDEGKWIHQHAYLYGFIIRYPKGKENMTGYQYESWHLRYVGKELATKLYNNGDWLTLEEYYGISSSYE